MIYVDTIDRRTGFCHMISDQSIDELHTFARSLLINPCWFENKRKKKGTEPHYDLLTWRRDLAVKAGATEISKRELKKLLTKTYGAAHL